MTALAGDIHACGFGFPVYGPSSMPCGSMPSVSTALGTLRPVAEELLEPALQVHAVPQHEIGILRFHDVRGVGS